MDVIFKLKLHLSREHIYWIISVSRDKETSIIMRIVKSKLISSFGCTRVRKYN